MKTNGLRNKKPQCARAAERSQWNDLHSWRSRPWLCLRAILNWHRATWRK